jgi:hypothetical protein
VLNRGTERRSIFYSNRCYERFIELLSILAQRFGVALHGYALMSCIHLNPVRVKALGGHETRDLGRLSLKELGQLAGGIHHNAVGIALRRFMARLENDHTLRGKLSLVEKALQRR